MFILIPVGYLLLETYTAGYCIYKDKTRFCPSENEIIEAKGLKEILFRANLSSLCKVLKSFKPDLKSFLVSFAILGIGEARTMRRNNRMESQ